MLSQKATARWAKSPGGQGDNGNMGARLLSNTHTTTPNTTSQQITQSAHFDLSATLPAELTELAHWVCWRYVQRPGEDKPTKVPVNARTSGNAMSNNPATWATFDEAVRCYDRNPGTVAGLGFMQQGTDLAGIDLDNCIDEAGTVAPWALAIIRRLDSYTEISPSGRGVRIFVRGTKPGRREKTGSTKRIELYDGQSVRFLTVTGERLPGCRRDIADRHDELARLYHEVFPKQAKTRKADPQPVGLDDQAILSAMFRSKAGVRLYRLWHGDVSGYDSPSEADCALAGSLVWWTGGDEETVDRLFRQSALMRDKWDERHAGDGRTYGQITIDYVLGNANTFYTPGTNGVAAGGEIVDEAPAVGREDVWQCVTEHLAHMIGHCPICGRYICEKLVGPEMVKGRTRIMRCKSRDCEDWRRYRATEVVISAELWTWEAHFVATLPDDAYQTHIDGGILSREAQWLGMPSEDGVTVFSAFRLPGATAIAWQTMATMAADAWLTIPKDRRLRRPKAAARAKREAVACEAEQADDTMTERVDEPKDKPEWTSWAYGLDALNRSQLMEVLNIIEAMGGTVDRKRRRWEYPIALDETISDAIGKWQDLMNRRQRSEIKAKGKKHTMGFISDPITLEAVYGELDPWLVEQARRRAARERRRLEIKQ